RTSIHHFKARKEAEDFSDGYYGALERHLGLSNGHTERHNGNVPNENNAAPPSRSSAPMRPATVDRPAPRMSAPVSAPPTREAPSMTTGRSGACRAPLTADELQIAQACGQTPQEYQAQKERWAKMKAEGAQ